MRMRFRIGRKKYMFYPEDQFLDSWNSYITLVLLFTAIVAPIKVAFVEDETQIWHFINFIVDFSFLIDILVTFNSAFINEETLMIVDNRNLISITYLSGWFWIDVLSIIPFDLIANSQNNMNSMMKLLRISRMYKLIKLTRLIRMVKIIKNMSKV